ncbi:polysaccharide biosynthesis/export family protein [Cupriavidus agavae]|nr:polysaccharide biosynthesis/export family protein [Cupriavidus agavae]
MLAMLLAALALHGCMLAPGMRGALSFASTASDSAEAGDPAADPSGAPGAPGVTAISWDLVNTLQAHAGAPPADLGALLARPGPYQIGAADILSIVVWDHPELMFPHQTYSVGIGYDAPGYGGASTVPGYVVDRAGEIQFPYAGRVRVAGMTVGEARDELTRRIGRVIAQPQVTVRVLAYRSQRVYLDGEVRTPGPQYIDDVPMTLVEALNRAGGVHAERGDSSRITLHRDGRRWDIDLPALLRAGQDPAGIGLRSGDIVRVAQREDSKVFVLGEVHKPSVVLPRNGRLSLNEALGEAGGVNPMTSDPQHIYVVRKHETGGPEVFHLDARSPVALALAEGFPLKPRDVVFVDAGDITRWARVVNQLIPSAQYLNSTASVLK